VAADNLVRLMDAFTGKQDLASAMTIIQSNSVLETKLCSIIDKHITH
jgi:hypothetical protein